MRAVIVDDEHLAVEYLSKVLADIGKTELVATYTSSLIAKKEIIKQKPDVVFLDIEMPQLNGLELGSFIRSELPDVKIIFITSYEQYAIDAIAIGNIEYILKPFEPELIEEKLDNIPQSSHALNRKRPMVCLLGELNFIYYEADEDIEASQVIYGKWRTKSAREIFMYLMNYRGKYVRKDFLIDTFWSGHSNKEAYNILYATIHHIRKFLKEIDLPIMIENKDDAYRLHLNGVLVDVDYWLMKIKELNDPTDDCYQNIASLYRNHYLIDESALWVEYNRQRYRIKWLAFMRDTLSKLEAKQEYNLAILYALKYQYIEPNMEEPYFMLMKLFAKTRDYISVSHQFERVETMMEKEYNDKPNEEIIQWYTAWRNDDL